MNLAWKIFDFLNARRSPIDENDLPKSFPAYSANDVRDAVLWLKDRQMILHTRYQKGRGHIADQLARSSANFSLWMQGGFRD